MANNKKNDTNKNKNVFFDRIFFIVANKNNNLFINMGIAKVIKCIKMIQSIYHLPMLYHL
jgi:hypothetical protein